MSRYAEEIQAIQDKTLFRKRRVTSKILEFPYIEIDGQKLVNFGSNNYLGLSKEVNEYVLKQITKVGIIQQASPLITGYTEFHQELEEKIAIMKDQDSAILFSSGFLANLSVITTLATENDQIFIDKLSHASIMEVTKYKHINFRIFPHKNYDYLRTKVKGQRLKDKGQRTKVDQVFVVSDSLFSMSGDTADITELVQIAQENNAYLIIDDAHATGVFGNNGTGLAAQEALQRYSKAIVTGSMSKGLNSYGGFVACSQEITDYLVNKAKPYIYNTALPLIHVLAALKTIDLLQTTNVQGQLWENISFFEGNFNQQKIESPIVPIKVGDNKEALRISRNLQNAGFFVPAIRYPTVPKRDAMLRISISRAHTKSQLRDLAKIISEGSTG